MNRRLWGTVRLGSTRRSVAASATMTVPHIVKAAIMPGPRKCICGFLLIGLGRHRPESLSSGAVQASRSRHSPATRDQVVLDAIGSAFRIEHRHASATDALSATSFDAASVHAATPAHADLIRLLIKRGVPTFVDKPLADKSRRRRSACGLGQGACGFRSRSVSTGASLPTM